MDFKCIAKNSEYFIKNYYKKIGFCKKYLICQNFKYMKIY